MRALKGADIRKVGSGSIGASNVWRTYGRWLGIPVIALDVLKGFVPTLVASVVAGDIAGALAGGAAMAGHWRPLFLRFERGGKMVATCGGALFALAPLAGLATAAIWLLVFLAFRYTSVASILAALALPLLAIALGEPWPVLVFLGGASAGVLVLHRSNVARLRAGTENRFQLRRRAAPAR